MGLSHKLVAIFSLSLLLASSFFAEGSTLRIVRRGRRTGLISGGYGGGGELSNSPPAPAAPELPALYSAPNPPQEDSQNEVSAEQIGTTTEISSEEQSGGLERGEDVGASEDYIFSSATQMTGHEDTTESSEKELDRIGQISSSSVAPSGGYGGSGGYQDIQIGKNTQEAEQTNEILSNSIGQPSGGYFSRGTALDQQQVENHEHFQVQTQAPSSIQEPSSSYEQIKALHQPAISYIPQPERQDFPNPRQQEQQSGGYGGRSTEIPQPRYAQQQESRGSLDQQTQSQLLYQSPQQQYYQAPQAQPQQFYESPPAQAPQQPQQYKQSSLTQPQQLYQQPRAQQQQYSQPPAQQNGPPPPQESYQPQNQQQTYQQPPQQRYGQPQQHQQQPQQQYGVPQQQQGVPQQQHGVPQQQHDVSQQQHQQQYGLPQQQNQQPQLTVPEPVAYHQPQQQPQQHSQYQSTTTQNYIQPEQPQPQSYPRQYEPQPQQQQPQIQGGYNSPQFLAQPQPQPNYVAQGQQQQGSRSLYQPAAVSNINGNTLDSPAQSRTEIHGNDNEDTAALEGLNDNVVDAELLERVQQIIEEHERQQKEQQQRLRQSTKEREEIPPNGFQSNIYSSSNEIPTLSNNNNNNNGNHGSEEDGYSNNRQAARPQQGYGNGINEEVQQPQQNFPQAATQSRNIPQSYFQENSPQQRREYDRTVENRGRALMENKHIDFQPAILTSHFVEESNSNQNGRNVGAPVSNGRSYGVPQQQQQQQNSQAQAQYPPPQSYQQIVQNPTPTQNIYVASPQSDGSQPNYPIPQPQHQSQQPESYFGRRQQQQQPQVADLGNSYGNYPQSNPLLEQNQENSLEYYQRPEGYSQPQHIYVVPMHQAVQYQQQQPEYSNFQAQDTNAIHGPPETSPPVITRTIVIHERPTTAYGAENNRAIITADDLRGGSQYPSSPQVDLQAQHQDQPQQYQYLTASAQLSLAPETDSYSPVSVQGQIQSASAAANAVTPPRPIYGVPLAPALGLEDLERSQGHVGQTVVPAQQNYLPPSSSQGSTSYAAATSGTDQVWNPSTISEGYRVTDSVRVGGAEGREQADYAPSANGNTPVPLVSNTVSLPTREYAPSQENQSDEQSTTSKNHLPYGRRIDRHIRKRFSTAVTSPLAGFFSVKAKNQSA